MLEIKIWGQSETKRLLLNFMIDPLNHLINRLLLNPLWGSMLRGKDIKVNEN